MASSNGAQGKPSLKDPNATRIVGGLIALIGLKAPMPLRLISLAVGGYLAVRGTPTLYQMKEQITRTVETDQHVVIERAVTIQRSAEAVFTFWRDFTNFPLYMKDVRQVVLLDDKGRHWEIHLELPAPLPRQWEVRITELHPNEAIVWETTPENTIEAHGSIRFRELPMRNGVEVRLTIAYQPPGGNIAYQIAKSQNLLIGQRVKEAMMRLKNILETGEYPRTEGQPHGEAHGSSHDSQLSKNSTALPS